MGSTAADRRESIARRVAAVGDASVTELAELFSVTPSTIRRDLTRLAASGRLARTYGGILSLGVGDEESLSVRAQTHYDAKLAIAEAAESIEFSGRVFLDAGTTLGALAHQLKSREDISVVTTSLLAVETLRGTGIALELIGGDLREPSGSFFGPAAEATVERTSFDYAIVSADGIDSRRGLCEADARQSRLKELVIERAAQTIVLAHSQKLENQPFHHWTKLPTSWTLVTDAGASAATKKAFEGAGAKVLMAG